jgi:hypothetical protein
MQLTTFVLQGFGFYEWQAFAGVVLWMANLCQDPINDSPFAGVVK